MFKKELGEIATIACSGEQGQVIARAEYQHSERSYLIRYQSADGRAVQQWWDESAIG